MMVYLTEFEDDTDPSFHEFQHGAQPGQHDTVPYIWSK